MYLTSLHRLRRICGELADNATNNAEISALLASVSSNIETFLGRSVEKTTYTEYFDTEHGQFIYYPEATPIASITSLYSSVSGKFTGEESQETDYYLGRKSESFVFRRDLGQVTRGLRAIFIGGLAEHEVESTYVVTVTGAFTNERFVRGSKSGALGRVKDGTAGAFVIENISGQFRIGDVLSESANEAFTGTLGTGAGTITAITKRGLSEGHPAISTACEFEVNYLFKNSKNSSLWVALTGKEGSQKDGSYLGYAPYVPQPLRPETQRMLLGYRRIHL